MTVPSIEIPPARTWRDICNERRGGPAIRPEDLDTGFYAGGVWLSNEVLAEPEPMTQLGPTWGELRKRGMAEAEVTQLVIRSTVLAPETVLLQAS